jgi:hypothetical protein
MARFFYINFISTDHEALKEAVLHHAVIETTSSLVPSLHFVRNYYIYPPSQTA